jgi:hypothetical protein
MGKGGKGGTDETAPFPGPLKFAVQRFYRSLARTRVGVNRTQNLQCSRLIDGAYLGGYIWPEADLLHGPC